MKAVGYIQTISGKSLGTINAKNLGAAHAELESVITTPTINPGILTPIPGTVQ